MHRLRVKQIFRTWVKALLYCGYKYRLNLLVTLVIYKKNGQMYKLSLIPSQVIKF